MPAPKLHAFQAETGLQYSEYTDWNQLARWAADLFEAPAPKGPVLLRRYGDCKDKTLLLVSPYKALGLEARPVVLGMSVRRGLNDLLPAPTPFDHAIVQLRLDGNTCWLDPTAQQKPKDIGERH